MQVVLTIFLVHQRKISDLDNQKVRKSTKMAVFWFCEKSKGGINFKQKTRNWEGPRIIEVHIIGRSTVPIIRYIFSFNKLLLI